MTNQPKLVDRHSGAWRIRCAHCNALLMSRWKPSVRIKWLLHRMRCW